MGASGYVAFDRGLGMVAGTSASHDASLSDGSGELESLWGGEPASGAQPKRSGGQKAKKFCMVRRLRPASRRSHPLVATSPYPDVSLPGAARARITARN